MRLAILALALVPLAVVGQEMADYGDKPDQSSAEEMALPILNDSLKDPYSAHIEWREIVGTTKVTEGGPLCFGWVLVASVNAKNSYGAYVGARDYRFIIRDGRVDCAVTDRRNVRRGATERVRIY